MMGRVTQSRCCLMLLVAMSLNLIGCSTWRQTYVPSEPVAARKLAKRVRAHLVDGSVVVLHDPWFAGDTLYGRTEARALPSDTKPEIYGRSQGPPSTKLDAGDSTAIPIAHIASLEAWEHSLGRTVAFTAGMTLVVVCVLLLITSEGLKSVGNLGTLQRAPAPRP